MRILITSLQPNARIFINHTRLEVDAVVPAHGPLLALLVATRHQVPNTLEHILVHISLITRRNEHEVDIQRLLGRRARCSVLAAVVADAHAQTTAAVLEFRDGGHSPVVQKALWPVLFTAVSDALGVQSTVDLFQQLETHDTVVGALVESNGLGADGWLLRVVVVDTVGIEDLVDADGWSVSFLCKSEPEQPTMASHRLVAVPHL